MGILILRGFQPIVRYAGSFLKDMAARKTEEKRQLRLKLSALETESNVDAMSKPDIVAGGEDHLNCFRSV